jgi:prepilin-type N-terminal cleavage/methylation domain-containing protein
MNGQMSLRCLGFSLTELLIALMILGEIAAFSIPKILIAQQDARNRAVLKETVGMLTSVLYLGIIKGEITASTNVGQYVADRVNYLKFCPGNSSAQGCWNTTIQGTAWGQETGSGGFILHNGAVIAGMGGTPNIGTPTQMYSGFALDVNGTEGPNTSGVDILDANICLGPSPCANLAATKYGSQAPGSILSVHTAFIDAFSK